MSSQTTNPPKVFISYSWDSLEHMNRVLELSDRLRSDGIDCSLDQYEVSPREGWSLWMEGQIHKADFVLMICTETYCRRVKGEEIPGKGHGVRWEGNLIRQHLYNAGTLNTKFIPVLLESGEFKHIPTSLQGTTFYSAHTEKGYEDLYRHLTNQPGTPKPELGKRKELPPRDRKQDFSNQEPGLEPSTGNEDYTRLRDLLADEQWREADEETWCLMLRAAGREQEGNLREEDLKKISCEVLRHINNLWVEFSAGHFGFGVQKEIWQSPEVNYDLGKFIARVGWGETKIDEAGTFWFIFKHIDNLSFNLAAPKGQLPVILGYNSQLRSESISRFIRCGLGNTTF